MLLLLGWSPSRRTDGSLVLLLFVAVVADLRGKEEYELGDFVVTMDEMAKSMTEELTGKDYEPGDLSIELDNRIKKAVTDWSGKEEYEFGDLSREIASRVQVSICC